MARGRNRDIGRPNFLGPKAKPVGVRVYRRGRTIVVPPGSVSKRYQASVERSARNKAGLLKAPRREQYKPRGKMKAGRRVSIDDS